MADIQTICRFFQQEILVLSRQSRKNSLFTLTIPLIWVIIDTESVKKGEKILNEKNKEKDLDGSEAS